jgi:hypothetical protein
VSLKADISLIILLNISDWEESSCKTAICGNKGVPPTGNKTKGGYNCSSIN